MTSFPLLKLKAPAEKFRRTPWIFANDVEHLSDSVLSETRTAIVNIDAINRFGIYNKSALISVRLFPKSASSFFLSGDETSLESYLTHRLGQLRTFKKSLGILEGESYRLCHGESDGIPGIVVDDYESLFVVQSSSFAGDFLMPYLTGALQALAVKHVFERSSGQARRSEQLPERTRSLFAPSVLPESVTCRFVGLSLSFQPTRAQKTGLFLDQRHNLGALKEILLARKAKPRSVLDICSYVGAWSSTVAALGADHCVLIDQDKAALENAAKNIEANAAGTVKITGLHGDLFEHLALLGKAPDGEKTTERFDVVVADPPAFAKTKKHVAEAKIAYSRLTRSASRLVAEGGIYVACSCSRNLEEAEFLEVVSRNLQGEGWILLRRGNQSADHTVMSADTLSDYLKCFFFLKRPF